MEDFSFNPSWVRKVLLIIAGANLLLVLNSASAYLIAGIAPTPDQFIPLLLSFFFSGAVFWCAYKCSGPLKILLWVMGVFGALGALSGLVLIATAQQPQLLLLWLQLLYTTIAAGFYIWVAAKCIRYKNEQIAS